MNWVETVRLDSGISFDEATAQRRAIVTTFVEGLAPNEKGRAERQAALLFAQGGYLADTVVVTPVAGHQEQPETIIHALGEYAKQKDAEPFTIILGVNYPASEKSNPLIARNFVAIEEARSLYPDLDIRATEQSYPGRTAMGRIRRDVWNSAIVLSEQRNEQEGYQETFGLNQDIDLITLSPHFMATIRERMANHINLDVLRDFGYWAHGLARPGYTPSKHAYDPRYPNVSHAVMWQEFARQQTGNYFEAGAIIPFVYYAKHGGIDARQRIDEVNTLIRRGEHGHINPVQGTSLHGIYSETDIRRYVNRLHANDFSQIWTWDTFSQFDSFRGDDTFQSDISHDRLEELVAFSWQQTRDTLLSKVYKDLYKYPLQPQGAEKIRARTDRILFLAQTVLERVLHLPDVANMVAAERKYLPRMMETAYRKEFEEQATAEAFIEAHAEALGISLD